MEEVMELESSMGKNTRKPPQDMNAPKRPMSAFFLWAGMARPPIMKANPEWSVCEIGKELGRQWKKVPKSVVEGYKAMYRKARDAYNAKMAKYQETESYKNWKTELLAFKIHQTKKPFPADPKAPKRNLSAYMLFAASVRKQVVADNPGMAVTDLMKEQAKLWSALSEADRKPWIEKYKAGWLKYEKAVEKYHKTGDYQNYVLERAKYKFKMITKRNALMKIQSSKKRARSESGAGARKAKRAKRAPSRRRSASRRRSVRRSKTPKIPKSGSRRRATSRRTAKYRRAKAPKGPKRRRSSSRSASTSRSMSRSMSRHRVVKSSRSSRASSRRSRSSSVSAARASKKRRRSSSVSTSRSPSRRRVRRGGRRTHSRSSSRASSKRAPRSASRRRRPVKRRRSASASSTEI